MNKKFKSLKINITIYQKIKIIKKPYGGNRIRFTCCIKIYSLDNLSSDKCSFTCYDLQKLLLYLIMEEDKTTCCNWITINNEHRSFIFNFTSYISLVKYIYPFYSE